MRFLGDVARRPSLSYLKSDTHVTYSSSRPEVFCKKGVLKNFSIFTGKHHLFQSLLFNKVAGLRQETLAQVFSCEFYNISTNTFFIRTPRWLLLYLGLRIINISMSLKFCCHTFNPFQSNATFLYPLKTSENHRFSDVFRGYRNVTLDKMG